MKLKMFRTKNELAYLRSLIDDMHKTNQARIDVLESEVFKLKHPNGEVFLSNYLYFGNGCINFKYAYCNSIKVTEVYRIYQMHSKYVANKVVTKGKYAYVGLKFERDGELSENYFIVDMRDGKAVEYTNQEIMGTIKWVPIT